MLRLTIFAMNSNPLDDLLHAYSKQPLPPPPPFSRAEIWRDIDVRRRRSSWLRLLPVLSWRDLFAEPRVAVAGLMMALLTGMVPAAVASSSKAPRLARSSLHLDVFSTCSGCRPVTHLNDHGRR